MIGDSGGEGTHLCSAVGGDDTSQRFRREMRMALGDHDLELELNGDLVEAPCCAMRGRREGSGDA